MILGGIEIPLSFGLMGHSDADALIRFGDKGQHQIHHQVFVDQVGIGEVTDQRIRIAGDHLLQLLQRCVGRYRLHAADPGQIFINRSMVAGYSHPFSVQVGRPEDLASILGRGIDVKRGHHKRIAEQILTCVTGSL